MNPILREAYSIDRFRASAHRVVDILADHLASSLAGDQPQALPWIEPELSQQLWDGLAVDGIDIERFCREVLAHSVHISDPKYMGHQISVPAPTAVIAGLITDCLNNGSGVYEMGMAGTAMEKHVVRRLARQFGMPATADGFLTSGGTLANLTAMLAARAVRSGGNDWSDGTNQDLSILVSDQAHYCVDRAVRIMGWGDAGIIRVPANERFAMQTSCLPDLLRTAERQGRKVIAIVGSACSTSTGSFDDLIAIGEFCRQHDLWFHVDGAHGAAVAFSQKHRHLLAGIESADSVAIDFHKMLMVPVISSALIFQRSGDSFQTFALQADYLFSRESGPNRRDDFNLAKRTFECTKSMLSAKVYSLLAIHGQELFEAHVDRLHELTATFASMLSNDARFELAIEPQTNIVCFRRIADGVSGAATSVWNERIRETLVQQGKHYIVKTVLRGETWLRCTLANPFTTEAHLQELLDAILTIGSDLQSRGTTSSDGS